MRLRQERGGRGGGEGECVRQQVRLGLPCQEHHWLPSSSGDLPRRRAAHTRDGIHNPALYFMKRDEETHATLSVLQSRLVPRN
ncbi:hypothetical protein EYF80_023083 [Liparis tanakae]|uniref:Uncharacterized protein n=1 Tax=Liparis tanakae TaxID=230148 RepID=A0A4Z2HP05_9TELE|nr:hypothetical protein EYF80_023083 [Liparis tanakae]